MPRIEQDNIVKISDGEVRLTGVFTPKEFKSFCLERSWIFSPRDGHAFASDGSISKASHFIDSQNTYFFL